jgi:hypothetical protein
MAYLAYLDGGERCSNNFGYYAYENVSQIFYNAGGLGQGNLNNLFINTNVNGQCYFSAGQTGSNDFTTFGGINNNFRWSPLGLYSSTIYCGFRFYTGTLDGYTTIYLCNGNGNPQISINFASNGAINVYSGGIINKQKGNGNTFIGGSSINSVIANSTIYLEIYLVVSSSGTVILRLNGNPTAIINVSGVNTASDSSSLPITFLETTNATNSTYIRDIYFTDGTGSAPFNTFLGDVSIQNLTPSANVAVQFTPNGNSSNYLNAAQTPPNSGTDYNNATTVGSTDTFTVNSLASNTSNALAVKLFGYSYGSGASAKILTSGSTTVTGTVNYLTPTAGVYFDLYTANPSTSGTWTTTAVNALTIGYTVIS